MENKICDECKIKPANIHLTQIVQNEVSVIHLCEECAKNKGVSIVIEGDEVPPLKELFDENSEKLMPPPPAQEKQITCPTCFTTFAEFKEKGWLGCTSCYRAFEKEIEALLVQIHGTSCHKGKDYSEPLLDAELTSDIKVLRAELENAVRCEKFELAALIRDKINSSSSDSPSKR